MFSSMLVMKRVEEKRDTWWRAADEQFPHTTGDLGWAGY